MNEYINLTLNNLDDEHICCAIGDPKHQDGVDNKKQWLKERFQEGHIFRKLNVRGKVFIEYAPLETSWTPVSGDNFMYIYCLWVSGSFKEKGYGKELLEYAIEDSRNKGKSGICTITSKKKKPFISEKAFFVKYGFKVVDTIGDYELLSLSFNGTDPKFNKNARNMKIDNTDLTIYYTPQCPFTANGIKEALEYSKGHNVPINIIKIDTLEKAKNVPCIFNNWAVFKDGKFVSNTLLNKNMIEKLYK